MDLDILTNEALIELYDNYTPQYSNLYKVEIFSNGYTTALDGINLKDYICFHTTKVSFNGESLSLDRDSVTKMFKLKNQDSYTRTNTLSLSWRECDGWKVKRYHDKWIGLIYDRKNDCYKSFDIKGEDTASRLLYRKIRVTFPYNIKENPKEEAYIDFFNVLPSNSGNIALEYNTTSSIMTHNIDYYVTDWGFSWDEEYTQEAIINKKYGRENSRFETEWELSRNKKYIQESSVNDVSSINKKYERENSRFESDYNKGIKKEVNKKYERENSRFESDWRRSRNKTQTAIFNETYEGDNSKFKSGYNKVTIKF